MGDDRPGKAYGAERKTFKLAISRYIRDHTEDGAELIGSLLDIVRGRKPGGKAVSPIIDDDLRLRMGAMEILLDRGWGKSPVSVEIDVEVAANQALRTYTTEELEAMAKSITAVDPSLIIEGELVANHKGDTRVSQTSKLPSKGTGSNKSGPKGKKELME